MYDTPKVRFGGFADAWEQRKLEVFLEVSGEKTLMGCSRGMMFSPYPAKQVS